MDRLVPFLPGIALAIAETALQVSGYSNPTLALALAVLAIITLGVPAVYSGRRWLLAWLAGDSNEPTNAPDLRNMGVGRVVAEPIVRTETHLRLQAETAPAASLSLLVNREQKADEMPEPDEWVLNAVRFVVWGHWNPQPSVQTTEVDAEQIFVTAANCVHRIAELAHRGKLTIWGSAGPGQRVKRIRREYWEGHQIPVVNVLDGREKEKISTDSNGLTRTTEVYDKLQINEQEFIAVWIMPLSEAATRAYEETRGSRAGDFSQMRHSDGKPQILNWYAYALLGMSFDAVPLYGKPLPSRKFERIPAVLLPSSAISDDATTLNDRTYGNVRFADLSIAREGLEDRISEIRGWG